MAVALRRVRGVLGGRKREGQPAVGVDRAQAERLGLKSAQLFRSRG
jgi:hypothetical protein